MAEEKVTKLMSEFPPVTTEQWETVIAADLKGADRTKKLVWRTMEGFNVDPYYRAEDLDKIKHLASQPGEFPYLRGVKKSGEWLVRQTITVDSPKETNAQALSVLMKGVDSLGFVVNGKEFTAEDLDTLLKGIDLKAIEVAFSGCSMGRFAGVFMDKIAKDGIEPCRVKASFAIDPLVKGATKGGFCSENAEKCLNKLSGLVARKGDFKKLRIATVSGNLFSDSGSSIVQELAFTLAAGHEYIVKLMDKGLTIDQAASSIKFNLSISANYFMEIAKFRAGRMLWANIVNAYKPEKLCSAKMRVHAITSSWNMTVYDPYVNMLRGTTETMSAAIAGVDSIEVLPFDHAFEKPTEFSARIARNTQLLLKEESHFDQVTDPSAGSYYIETLTASIADQAWSLFKQVEDKGGFIEALKAGFIQDTIAETSSKRDMNIATRREILLGTNQYPNFDEVAGKEVSGESVTRGGKCSCGCSSDAEKQFKAMTPYRGAMAFEEMRLKTDRSGKKPIAFMLTCGSLSFARARAQFACNFFACAGIKVVDNTYFSSVIDGVKAAIEAKADIVVICASDNDYATLAPQAYELLGAKGIFVVAGAPASQAELEAKGINHFISVKSNVLETLKGYQKELGI